MGAGHRGLAVAIVRPGYVMGDSRSAVTNTDDFIWRLVKGCIQLGLVPDINNTVNMVPVDHVARCSSLSALVPPPPKESRVYHITARPPIRFNDLLGSLAVYGYGVSQCDYVEWRTKLEQHVMEVQDNALFPLLHYVLDDLPTSTTSPELNDSNTAALLETHHEAKQGGMDIQLIGMYLAWLITADFLPAPPKTGTNALPLLEGVSGKAVGRTGR